MTLNQIEYFCTIARYENYRAAADKLHIAQPSLSRSMMTLEEELGIALFERRGRGIVLTKAGRIFLEHANRILEDCSNALDEMHELAEGGGSIEIGYIFPLAGHYIPSRVRSFLNEEGNEKISFSFWQNHTPAIIERLTEGTLDVGFGGCVDHLELEYYPILSQELVVISPCEYAISSQDAIDLREFENHPVIGYESGCWMGIHTRALFEKFQIRPNMVVECPDEYSIASLVRQGFGIALIPQTDILEDMDGISVHPVKNEALAHQIYMFWVKEREQSPAVERFIEYMKEQAEPMAASGTEDRLYLRDLSRTGSRNR